jgi:hypothetical protein
MSTFVPELLPHSSQAMFSYGKSGIALKAHWDALKLVDRVKKYNPWNTKMMQISEKNYLRPIPQNEIDLSQPAMKQNPGY